MGATRRVSQRGPGHLCDLLVAGVAVPQRAIIEGLLDAPRDGPGTSISGDVWGFLGNFMRRINIEREIMGSSTVVCQGKKMVHVVLPISELELLVVIYFDIFCDTSFYKFIDDRQPRMWTTYLLVDHITYVYICHVCYNLYPGDRSS